MALLGGRLRRERLTVEKMIALYCRLAHGQRTLCSECAALSAYAGQRLQKCPFGDAKPACNKCTVHCYRRQEREQIRVVMRFSGPRMLTRHPLLALLHLWDERIQPRMLPRRHPRALASRPPAGEAGTASPASEAGSTDPAGAQPPAKAEKED